MYSHPAQGQACRMYATLFTVYSSEDGFTLFTDENVFFLNLLEYGGRGGADGLGAIHTPGYYYCRGMR